MSMPLDSVASMRPAQKAPENGGGDGDLQLAGIASMRPAQKAPENRQRQQFFGCSHRRFNEAGAKSAGKPRRCWFPPGRRRTASMRPAQKAPENETLTQGRESSKILLQ